MKPVSIKLNTPPEYSFKFKNIHLSELVFNWHYHPEYEIMFMRSSKGKRFIGDNIAHYSDGDLFLMGPNLPHAWYSPESTSEKEKIHDALLIQFLGEISGLGSTETPEFKYIHKLFHDSVRGLQFFGETREQAAEKLLLMESQTGVERLLTLLSTLDILGKATGGEVESLSSIEFFRKFQPDEQSRIDKVCTHINQNYKEQLKLERVAHIANMSITAFSRFFKKSTGKTFVKYVNELRIGHACKLLIESEFTIAEICYEVGFNNLSNFNRRFYERQHMSPKNYRKEFSV